MKLALDTASKRHIDENGFLHVAISNISKECISGYYGYEIPNYLEEGLDAEKIYYAYRKGEELAKGADTFNGLPLLSDHYIEHADNPQKEYRVGSLGTNAGFNAPYLTNSLIVTDTNAIEKIESGECVELSAAYMYTPLFEKGIFEGQEYDFIMTNIRGNHVALVANGRAGSDVFVADSAPNSKFEELKMKKVNKDNEILEVLDNTTNIEEEVKEVLDNKEESANIVELEENAFCEFQKQIIENLPQYLASIRLLNQLFEQLSALDTQSIEEENKEDKDKNHAMDRALEKKKMKEEAKKEAYKEIRAVEKAIMHCQPFVGQLDNIAFDSADEVYFKACNLLKLSANKKSAKDVILALKQREDGHFFETIEVDNMGFVSRFQ